MRHAHDIRKGFSCSVVLLDLKQMRFRFGKRKELTVVLSEPGDAPLGLNLRKVVGHDGAWLAHIGEVQHTSQRIDNAPFDERGSVGPGKLGLV